MNEYGGSGALLDPQQEKEDEHYYQLDIAKSSPNVTYKFQNIN
jgi:hypothetical protein